MKVWEEAVNETDRSEPTEDMARHASELSIMNATSEERAPATHSGASSRDSCI